MSDEYTNEEERSTEEGVPEVQDETPAPSPEPSLEDLAKSYNMSPADVIKAYGESRTKMAHANQALSDYKREMQWAEQFRHELSSRKGLREHIESFFEDNSGSREVPASVRAATDPVVQEVNQLKTYVLSMQMNKKLDEIGSEFPMNQDIRDRVFEEVARTGNDDVEAHYFKIMGRGLVKQANAEVQDTQRAIKNKNAYVQNRGGGIPPKAPDIRGMSQAEWSDALDNDLAKAFRTTE